MQNKHRRRRPKISATETGYKDVWRWVRYEGNARSAAPKQAVYAARKADWTLGKMPIFVVHEYDALLVYEDKSQVKQQRKRSADNSLFRRWYIQLLSVPTNAFLYIRVF